MPSTISAGTTAGTALNFTSDTTGNLAFQTNGTTTALSIDTNQNVTFANNVTYNGTITATAGFSGNGAGLSAINASNVSSGTLASARLPTSGVNAASITTGTLAVANGGTGTASPSLVAGSGISVSGSFPNQTITNTSSVNSNQLAKAWVTFNGNNGSTYSSYNVSSVTRNGTADYTLNFTSALANSNYAWSGSAVSAASQSIFVSGNPNTPLGSGRSTTSLNVAGFYQNSGRNNDTDNAYYSIIVIGS